MFNILLLFPIILHQEEPEYSSPIINKKGAISELVQKISLVDFLRKMLILVKLRLSFLALLIAHRDTVLIGF